MSRFNPEMLSLVREASGLTQSALAEHLGVAQSTISKLEHGVMDEPDEEVLKACADMLGVTLDYFYRTEPRRGASVSFYRKRKGMKQRELNRLEAKLQMLRLDVGKLMLAADFDSNFDVPEIDPGKIAGGAREVARRVRAAWQILSGPIRDLMRRIESAGVLIIEIAWSQKFDAMSIPSSDGIPHVIFVNSNMPCDRRRFTLAHELGHLVMHRIPTDTMEDEADEFASEFLMPSKEIMFELRNLQMRTLPALKLKWGVSMMALVKTAHTLNRITDRQYRSRCVQLSKSPQINDNVQIPEERPTLLNRLIQFHRDGLGYSIKTLAQCLHLPPDVFCEKYGIEPAPYLKVIQGGVPQIPNHVQQVVEL